MGECGRLYNDVQPEYKEKYVDIVFSITESVDVYLVMSFN